MAAAVAEQYPLKKYPKVVAVLGPGGNGGDGMVAARHLASMGYEVAAYYPKRNRGTARRHGYQRDEHLLAQAAMLGVTFCTCLPSPATAAVVLDAILASAFMARHGLRLMRKLYKMWTAQTRRRCRCAERMGRG